MNNDFYMNDTLDNFVFTQTVDDFTKVTAPVTPLDNKGNKQIKIAEQEEKNKDKEISLDDSVFFSELSFSADTNQAYREEKFGNQELARLQNEKSTISTIDPLRDNSTSFKHGALQLEKGNDNANKEILKESINQSKTSDNTKNQNVIKSKKGLSISNHEIRQSKNKVETNQVRNVEERENKTDFALNKLSLWGLPQSVLEKYEIRGIVNMFSWQLDCLSNVEVLNNSKNLVYSAPTSAGKTLVAEILALKTIFERQKKIICILPFVSIVREKMYYFQDILASSGIRVDGFMGSYNPPGGFNSVDFAVCTIEKANNLVNRLLEDNKLSDIGAILVDEIHLLGDPSRGYLLELLLTKLKYYSSKDENVKIQVIGMSATLPNLNHIAKWLNAELYTTSFRPIPLHEQAHVCGEIYDNNLKLVRKLSPLPDVDIDTDNILQLCLETIKESCSVLIFCPTKNWCENLSQQIATAFFKIGNTKTEWGEILRSQLKTDLIMELLGQLKYCPVGLDPVLRKTVSFGVAFHHAGLTMDERDIIEGAFRNGALRVLVATSTLSSGVNLPARRVIIRTPHFHGKPLDPLIYRQMIGRAGRMGKDAVGESLLICQKNDYKIAKELMSAELSPVESCLEGAGKLKRAILEVIASGVASSPDDVALFTRCTLLAVEDNTDVSLENPIEETVDFLKNNEFIRLQKQQDGSEKYVATSLGKACLSSSMAPDEGLALFTELEKARRCFVLETELHLIYLVTPYSACNSWDNIDWMLYLELWVKLPSTMKRVGELVGVQESYIINATRGKLQVNTSKTYHKMMIHKRFYVALALQDLVNEKPLAEVCAKFNCNRGLLQSLQQSSSSFAGMVTSFSRQLGWSSVEILLSQFQDRMQFGVSRELIDLMRLSILNGPMARILYNSGIETITQLANSTIETVENILYKTIPFETKKEREGESEFDKHQRNKFRVIWMTGKEGLTEREAAEILVTSARKYVKFEMGLAEAKWETEEQNSRLSEVDVAENGNIDVLEIQATNSQSTDIGDNIKSMCKISEDKSELEHLSVEFEKVLSPKRVDVESFEREIVNEEKLELKSHVQIEEQVNCVKENIANDDLYHHADDDIDDCIISDNSNFSDINFSLIEGGLQNVSSSKSNLKSCRISDNNNSNKTFKVPHYASSKVEVSQILLSPSQAELNISDSSVFSSQSNFNTSDKIQSDQSLFDDSFTLHLSESDKESPKQESSNNCNNLNNTGNHVSLKKLSNEMNISDDILSSSDISTEEILVTPKKRKNHSKENWGISNKKKKNTKVKGKTLSLEHVDNNLESAVLVQDKIKQNVVHAEMYKITDVCEQNNIWEHFEKEFQHQKYFCLSLGCSRIEQKKPLIGMNIIQPVSSNMESEKIPFSYRSSKLDGISVTWNGNKVFYCSLENKEFNVKVLNLLRLVLRNKLVRVNIFDSKEQIKLLYFCCGVNFEAKLDDPKIADWLLDPEGREKGLWNMALTYNPETTKLYSAVKGLISNGVGSIALDCNNTAASRSRACIEVVIGWHLMNSLRQKLSNVSNNYLKIYDYEMATSRCLAKVEINGIGIRRDLLQKLIDTLKNKMLLVEKNAFSLAGRRFNFTSSTDVAKVLGMFRGKKVSTRKQVLEQSDHPVSSLVLQWRKTNHILTKTIYPLVKMCRNDRIRGCYIMQTATGRITMHEPNLQNVAKDFSISDTITKEVLNVSCRNTFQVANDFTMVSADYCQLELRILAHLSQDETLCSIMKKPGDVFKSIAAKWNKVEQSCVTDTMRQNTKHICYGIIYGMHSRTLSKQLSIEEGEAEIFMETFKNTYPRIKTFIKKTIENCRSHGYVETIYGRRRYLPNILEGNASKRGQAERQAVNTTIQGSAADIAKRAMVMVENELERIFEGIPDKPKLVLHLHDELLYEVPLKYDKRVIEVIKKNMENCASLSVPLPVKIKIGRSWGQMTEYVL